MVCFPKSGHIIMYNYYLHCKIHIYIPGKTNRCLWGGGWLSWSFSTSSFKLWTVLSYVYMYIIECFYNIEYSNKTFNRCWWLLYKGYWCISACIGYKVTRKYSILCYYYLAQDIHVTSFVSNAMQYIRNSEQKSAMLVHKLKYILLPQLMATLKYYACWSLSPLANVNWFAFSEFILLTM